MTTLEPILEEETRLEFYKNNTVYLLNQLKFKNEEFQIMRNEKNRWVKNYQNLQQDFQSYKLEEIESKQAINENINFQAHNLLDLQAQGNFFP